jgi:hypothetical protein
VVKRPDFSKERRDWMKGLFEEAKIRAWGIMAPLMFLYPYLLDNREQQ